MQHIDFKKETSHPHARAALTGVLACPGQAKKAFPSMPGAPSLQEKSIEFKA
jgi:hypothetical protein